MVCAKRKDIAKLKRILARQREPRWGADYLPSIFATPAEAPSTSRPSILTPAKLGREVHVLSLPERAFALLALYSPMVVDLHEQKMLHTTPSPHPLLGFPGLTGQCYEEMDGLISVAERLGVLESLPKLHIRDTKTNTIRTVVFPYTGDFLLYLQPSVSSEVYCVNWSVKAELVAFKRPTIGPKAMMPGPDDIKRTLTRHQLERAYYSTGNIRTVHVAAEQIPDAVCSNLELCFGCHRVQIPIPKPEQEKIISCLQAAVEQGVPPSEVLAWHVAAGRISTADGFALFHKAIWERRLRVDLFHQIFIDYPVLPESEDVLDHFASWFAK